MKKRNTFLLLCERVWKMGSLYKRMNTYWAKLAISYLRAVMGKCDVAEAVDGVASAEWVESNVNKS